MKGRAAVTLETLFDSCPHVYALNLFLDASLCTNGTCIIRDGFFKGGTSSIRPAARPPRAVILREAGSEA